MATRTYTKSDVAALLREIQGDRTQTEFAAEIGVSFQYLNDVLHQRRGPGPAILNYLGMKVAFVKAEEKAA